MCQQWENTLCICLELYAPASQCLLFCWNWFYILVYDLNIKSAFHSSSLHFGRSTGLGPSNCSWFGGFFFCNACRRGACNFFLSFKKKKISCSVIFLFQVKFYTYGNTACQRKTTLLQNLSCLQVHRFVHSINLNISINKLYAVLFSFM